MVKRVKIVTLCTFAELPEWVTVAPYHQCAQTFQRCFRNYLFGSSAPGSPTGQQLEDKLANPTIPTTVLRGSILLVAMTECEDLPADPDYRIQVR